MRLHIPRPLHGWRAFIGEVGVIVLGVLLALAAQELATYVSARGDATELRQSMMDELAVDRARWEANHHDIPCALQQLDELRTLAARPGTHGLERFVRPLFWTMHDSAWQVARSSSTITVLPLRQRDELADLYFAIGVQQLIGEKALEQLTRVEALAKNADRTGSRNALPEAATEAQEDLKSSDGNFDYLEREFDHLGVRSNLSALGRNPFNYDSRCSAITPS